MSQLVIHRPDLQSFQQKYGQRLITILFWVVFFFFMRPLLGMLGWFFGLQLFADVMVVKGGYHSLLELLGWYFCIVLLMGAALKGWAVYNLLRYGRHEKRLRQPHPIMLEELAQHFQLDSCHLRNWQMARRVVLEHDDTGLLIHDAAGSAGKTQEAGVMGRAEGRSAPFSGTSHIPQHLAT